MSFEAPFHGFPGDWRLQGIFHPLFLGPVGGSLEARAKPGSSACAHPAIATLVAVMFALGLPIDRMLSVKSGKHLRPNGAANRTERVYGTTRNAALFPARRM